MPPADRQTHSSAVTSTPTKHATQHNTPPPVGTRPSPTAGDGWRPTSLARVARSGGRSW